MSIMKKTALTLAAATIAAGALTGAASARTYEQHAHRAYHPAVTATESRADAGYEAGYDTGYGTWTLNRSMPAFDNSITNYNQRNDGRLGTY